MTENYRIFETMPDGTVMVTRNYEALIRDIKNDIPLTDYGKRLAIDAIKMREKLRYIGAYKWLEDGEDQDDAIKDLINELAYKLGFNVLVIKRFDHDKHSIGVKLAVIEPEEEQEHE